MTSPVPTRTPSSPTKSSPWTPSRCGRAWATPARARSSQSSIPASIPPIRISRTTSGPISVRSPTTGSTTTATAIRRRHLGLGLLRDDNTPISGSSRHAGRRPGGRRRHRRFIVTGMAPDAELMVARHQLLPARFDRLGGQRLRHRQRRAHHHRVLHLALDRRHAGLRGLAAADRHRVGRRRDPRQRRRQRRRRSVARPVPYNVSAPANCPPPWLHPDQTLIGGLSSTDRGRQHRVVHRHHRAVVVASVRRPGRTSSPTPIPTTRGRCLPSTWTTPTRTGRRWG